MGYFRVVPPFFRRKHIELQLGENKRVTNMREILQKELEFGEQKDLSPEKRAGGNPLKEI